MFQRLSVAVQRFNEACLADTFQFPSPHRESVTIPDMNFA